MDAKTAIFDTNTIVDRFLNVCKPNLNEVEKSTIISLIFGAMNRYAQLKGDILPDDLQALTIYVLDKRFGFEVEYAAGYSGYLIKCTDRDFHPVIYNLIIKGMELYDCIDDEAFLKEKVNSIIGLISNNA